MKLKKEMGSHGLQLLYIWYFHFTEEIDYMLAIGTYAHTNQLYRKIVTLFFFKDPVLIKYNHNIYISDIGHLTH